MFSIPEPSPQPQYQETLLNCSTTDWGPRPPGDSYISLFRSSVRHRDLLSSSVDYFVTVVRVSHIFHCTTDTAAVLIVSTNRKYAGNAVVAELLAVSISSMQTLSLR